MLETGGTSLAYEMCVPAGPAGEMCVPKPPNRKTSSAVRQLLTFLLFEPRRKWELRAAQLITTLLTSRLITRLLNSLRCYATLRAAVTNHMTQQIDILVLHQYDIDMLWNCAHYHVKKAVMLYSSNRHGCFYTIA